MGLVRSLNGTLAVFELLVMLAATGTAAEPPRNDPALPGQGNLRQPAETPERVTTRKVITPEQQTQSTDATIANCLAIANGGEVAQANLAIAESKNDEVKKFAKMLVKDHSNMLSKLEAFGGHAGLNQSDARAPHAANAADRQPQLPQQGHQSFDFLNIKRQITQQCLASAQKCWQDKKPGKANWAFVGGQIVAHQHMLDEMMVLRKYASPELAQLIDKAMQATEQHKEHAEKLIAELTTAEYAKTAKN